MEVRFSSLLGFRRWTPGIQAGLPMLGSFGFYNIFWDYSINKAKCSVKLASYHIAPVFDCVCGFYATKKPPTAEETVAFWGEAELFGRVIYHEFGYRAEYAKVYALSPWMKCDACYATLQPGMATTSGIVRLFSIEKEGSLLFSAATGAYMSAICGRHTLESLRKEDWYWIRGVGVTEVEGKPFFDTLCELYCNGRRTLALPR